MIVHETELINELVVSIYDIRLWPRYEYYERAITLSRTSNLRGYAIESGFAILEDTQTLILLDELATPLVVEVLNLSKKERGVRLVIEREQQSGSMKTVLVSEI